MRIAVHIHNPRLRCTADTSAVPYTTISRDHVPQIGTVMIFRHAPDRRPLSGRVRDVIETDDPSAPDDRPTVAIVVEEIA